MVFSVGRRNSVFICSFLLLFLAPNGILASMGKRDVYRGSTDEDNYDSLRGNSRERRGLRMTSSNRHGRKSNKSNKSKGENGSSSASGANSRPVPVSLTQPPISTTTTNTISGRIPQVAGRGQIQGTGSSSSVSSSALGWEKSWEETCSSEGASLSSCVGGTNGVLEYCKGCIAAASTLSSLFALKSCVEDSTLCDGCKESVGLYYECGKEILGV